MNRILVVASIALLAAACGKKDDKAKPAKPPMAKTPAANTPPPTKPVAKPTDAAPAKPVDAAPKPFILTAKECKAASARSYALMERWNPKKLTKKQQKQVDDYAATMEGVSLTNCRRNLRAWYDCKMKAKKHSESEDCRMIGASDEDGDPP